MDGLKLKNNYVFKFSYKQRLLNTCVEKEILNRC